MRQYSSRRYSRIPANETRADRTTVWLLLLVVTALIIALTFSDANGAIGLF
jgi:hypothetical protein